MADRRRALGVTAAGVPAAVLLVASLLAADRSTAVSGMALPAAPGDSATGPIAAYFSALNAAGGQGAAAQQAFFRRTQHPDFPAHGCGLNGLTVSEVPAWSTVRADPDWDAPGTADRPRGASYLIAVSVVIKRNGITVGNQIGAEHVVILAGAGYGFAPCSTP